MHRIPAHVDLNLLRALIWDKLFIPTARGMQPTPLADQFVPQMQIALKAIGEALTSKESMKQRSRAQTYRVS